MLTLLSASRKSKIEAERQQLFAEMEEMRLVRTEEVVGLVDECHAKLSQCPDDSYDQVVHLIRDKMTCFGEKENRWLIDYSFQSGFSQQWFGLLPRCVSRSTDFLEAYLQVTETLLRAAPEEINRAFAIENLKHFSLLLTSKSLLVLELVCSQDLPVLV